MSTRCTAVVDAPAASDRLSAVLRAGLERAAEGAAQTNDTGVTVPSVLHPITSGPGPSVPGREQQRIPGPGFHEDRKQFPPEQVNFLSQKLPVEYDEYKNKLHFSRGNGNGAVLEKMESGLHASVQGDMYFEGGSGKEYMTAWVAKPRWSPVSWYYSGPRIEGEMQDRINWHGSEYITFAGNERPFQTIETFNLKFHTALAITDDIVPPIQGSDLEQGLLATGRGLAAALDEFADVTRAMGVGKPDYSEVIAKFGSRLGLSFIYKNVEYFPNQEANGVIFPTSKATVVKKESERRIEYYRMRNGDLKLNTIADGMDKAVLQRFPEKIEYKTIEQRQKEVAAEAARREEEEARLKAVWDRNWQETLKHSKATYPGFYKALEYGSDNFGGLSFQLVFFLVAAGLMFRSNERREEAAEGNEEEVSAKAKEEERAQLSQAERDARNARIWRVAQRAEVKRVAAQRAAAQRAAAMAKKKSANVKMTNANTVLAAFNATAAIQFQLMSSQDQQSGDNNLGIVDMRAQSGPPSPGASGES